MAFSESRYHRGDDYPRVRDGYGGTGLYRGCFACGKREQGAVAGVIASCGPLGFCVGPIVGGMLYQSKPELPYAVAAVMYIVLALFMGRLSRSVTSR